MRRTSILWLAIVSFALYAAETDSLEYVGSYSNQRFTGEHYYLTEVWLWKEGPTYVGVFLAYGGLGGDGPVRPMVVKIDKTLGGQGGEFSFFAQGFSFVGRFDSGRIVGNLKNGSDNRDGGEVKTVLSAGTNVQTIINPGPTLSSLKEWSHWVSGLK
jgi:hypothetical protein